MEAQIAVSLVIAIFLALAVGVVFGFQLLPTNTKYDCPHCARRFFQSEAWLCDACEKENRPDKGFLHWIGSLKQGCNHCHVKPGTFLCPACVRPFRLPHGSKTHSARLASMREGFMGAGEIREKRDHDLRMQAMERYIKERELEAKLADVDDKTRHYGKAQRVKRQADFLSDVSFLIDTRKRLEKIRNSPIEMPQRARSAIDKFISDIDSLPEFIEARDKGMKYVQEKADSGAISEEATQMISDKARAILDHEITERFNPKQGDSNDY